VSLSFFDKATEILKPEEDYPNEMILAQYRSILVSLRMGNLDDAIYRGNNALLISDKATDHSKSLVYEVLGVIHTFLGDFDKTIEYYEMCLEIHIKLDDYRLNMTYFNLIQNYLKVGALGKAQKMCDQLELLVKEREQKKHRYMLHFHQSLKLSRARISMYLDPLSISHDVRASYLEIINNDKASPLLLIHAYIQYLTLLISQVDETSDRKAISELKELLPKMRKHAKKFNLHTLLIKACWIQSRIAASEDDQETSEKYLQEARMLHSQYRSIDRLLPSRVEDQQIDLGAMIEGNLEVKMSELFAEDLRYERYTLLIRHGGQEDSDKDDPEEDEKPKKEDQSIR
jgi:tetratricopeptide (TPR) repeat protein